MMASMKPLLGIVIAWLALAALSVAQTTTPPATPSTPPQTVSTTTATPSTTQDQVEDPNITIKRRVDEVNVVFTVTDKKGRFVKDLKQDEIEVYDNNLPAEQIRDFRAETDLPLRVGLLIDASNSIRDRFKFEQSAAKEFLADIVRPKSDRAFVVGFDTTAEVTADFTDNTEKLANGIDMLRPGGGTALYDALYMVCRDKLMKLKEGMPVRRAIVLVSDGDDNQSRVTREEAIEMAQRAEVIVYTISTNISGVKLRGDRVLERIADATGGRAFFPYKLDDVAEAFKEIQTELRSQYSVAYKPADFKADGAFRGIKIVAKNDKHLKIRSREGYYAPKQ
jgi:VWFA-related protein